MIATPAARRSGLLVLLAEDDDGHATLIQRNLRRGGMHNRIVRLRNGDEVIECFARHNGTAAELVLLLDIHMPGRNGIEVLRSLKAVHRSADVPVVMLTTSSDPAEIDLCYRLGCSFFVTKAVDYAVFSDTVQRLGALLRDVELPWKHIRLPERR